MSIDLTRQRLYHQKLSHTTFKQPEQVVEWLGVVQAQDYAAAKWAVAQRAKSLTDEDLDQALASGSIIRTHILRSTWQFVSPKDVRWMLKLTAPRILAQSASYFRSSKLDTAIFKRSNAVLTKALQDGKQLTRAELVTILRKNGVGSTDLLQFTYLLIYAELQGILCSGGRQGKQFTYALLEEQVPPYPMLEHDLALAELARRYFLSHGPATLKDYTWWSGLTVKDAREGLEMIKSTLEHEVFEDQTYWFASSRVVKKEKEIRAYLLPNYDEYMVGYTDRSAIHDVQHNAKLDARKNFLFNNVIVIHGQVVGTWKRTIQKSSVIVELNPFRAFSKPEKQAIKSAVDQYGIFLNMPAILNGIK
jgi:hypothetical protein